MTIRALTADHFVSSASMQATHISGRATAKIKSEQALASMKTSKINVDIG